MEKCIEVTHINCLSSFVTKEYFSLWLGLRHLMLLQRIAEGMGDYKKILCDGTSRLDRALQTGHLPFFQARLPTPSTAVAVVSTVWPAILPWLSTYEIIRKLEYGDIWEEIRLRSAEH